MVAKGGQKQNKLAPFWAGVYLLVWKYSRVDCTGCSPWSNSVYLFINHPFICASATNKTVIFHPFFEKSPYHIDDQNPKIKYGYWVLRYWPVWDWWASVSCCLQQEAGSGGPLEWLASSALEQPHHWRRPTGAVSWWPARSAPLDKNVPLYCWKNGVPNTELRVRIRNLAPA